MVRLLPLVWLGLCWAESGPPTWPDGARLVLTEVGTGTLVLSWPEAENNLLDLVGYELSIIDLTNPSVTQLIFSGLGHPTIKEFLYDQFIVGRAYEMEVVAYNYNPSTSSNLNSDALRGAYTISVPIGFDPTTLSPSSFSWVSGAQSVLSIESRHPLNGNVQTVGPDCTIQAEPSCLPGRNFVAYIDNLCEMNSGVYECGAVQAGDAGWGVNPWLRGQSLTTFVGASDGNTATYNLGITPAKAGSYSLMVQATTPNSILAIYWDNADFQGSPANIVAQVGLDFAWEFDHIVAWSSEYVSARYLGYIVPLTSGTYDVQCLANTYCSVWVDDLLVLDSVGGLVPCYVGCFVGEFDFVASEYRRIRVDYVALTGDSFMKLQWRVGTDSYVSIPSEQIHRGAFITGAPFALTVTPGTLGGAASFIYGSVEAMTSPYIGKPYMLFIQVNDDSGNACTAFTATVEVVVGGVAVAATPLNPLVPDCVYSARVIHQSTGSAFVSATVNGQAVSNSPLSLTVNPGPPDAKASALLPTGTLTVGGPGFDLSIHLLDAYGNNVASDFDFSSLNANAQIRPTGTIVSPTNACGTRSNFTWIITCWGGAFRYLDDAQLIAQTIPPFSHLDVTFDTVSSSPQRLLVLADVEFAYAGDIDLIVTFGEDSMVTGAPIVLNVLTTGSPVVPSMCLAQFFAGVEGAPLLVDDTLVTAIVLLRDIAGNVLTDRASELVELVVTGTVHVTRFTCTYVTNKYYLCEGYASYPGSTVLSIEVNNSPAYMTSGTKPSDECKLVVACGTAACPCMQTREIAQLAVSAELVP